MSFIIVCPRSRLEEVGIRYQPHDMITLINAGTPVTRPLSVSEARHHYIAFNDINAPQDGLTPPAPEHIHALLRAVHHWDMAAPLLIHCYMGVSRSTAAAYIATCLLQPEKDEEALALELRKKAPFATPNALMIAIADQILSREGRMIAAIKKIGRGAEAFEGEPFEWDIDS